MKTNLFNLSVKRLKGADQSVSIIIIVWTTMNISVKLHSLAPGYNSFFPLFPNMSTLQYTKRRTCTSPWCLLVYFVFQHFCNTNSESGGLWSVSYSHCTGASLLLQCIFWSMLLFGRWEVFCFHGSEERKNQRETAVVWAVTHPTGGPHCHPGWVQWWQRGKGGSSKQEAARATRNVISYLYWLTFSLVMCTSVWQTP